MPLINHILGRTPTETTGVLRAHVETKYLTIPPKIFKIRSKRNQTLRNVDNIKSCWLVRRLFNVEMLNVYIADTSAIISHPIPLFAPHLPAFCHVFSAQLAALLLFLHVC